MPASADPPAAGDQSRPGRIWVDLSTAPDPLFFRPLARRLESRGYEVWTTARRYGETVAIAEAAGFAVEVVGRHGGRGTVRKAQAIGARAVELRRRAARRRPDVALSFNSYAQAVASRSMGVPFVTVADYEHQPANHLAFRLAATVIVPEGFSPAVLARQGAGRRRVVWLRGLKEHVTLADFRPDTRFPERMAALGISRDSIIVIMRPPATSSLYHRFPNEWFTEVLAHVAGRPSVTAVVLPRYPSQAAEIRALRLGNVVIPDEVVDGLNLVYWSDLVIGAGGSMNREAVVLGTPAYTVFAGRMAGVDERLIATGALVRLRPGDDLARLKLEKNRRPAHRPVDDAAAGQIVEAVVSAAPARDGSRRAGHPGRRGRPGPPPSAPRRSRPRRG